MRHRSCTPNEYTSPHKENQGDIPEFNTPAAPTCTLLDHMEASISHHKVFSKDAVQDSDFGLP